MSKPKSIFLCHSVKDKDFVRRLATDLTAGGIKVWVDEAEMHIGDSLIEKIEIAIDQVQYLGAVLSPASVGSPWVLKEVRIALHREFAGKRLVVIPILYRDCELPLFLRDKGIVDFREPANYDSGFQEVVEYVHDDFFDEPENTELSRHVETLPLTKLWRRAITLDAYSNALLLQFRNALHGMDPALDASDILTALSYTLFLNEVLRRSSIGEAEWDFICRLIEDVEIPTSIRYWTFYKLVIADHRKAPNSPNRIPDLFRDDASAQENPLILCISEFFDHSGFNVILRDRNGPRRILAYLWSRGDTVVRGRLRSELRSYAQIRSRNGDNIINPLQSILASNDQKQAEQVLDQVYSRWVHSKAEDGLERDRYLTSDSIAQILAQPSPNFIEDLLSLFRKASQRSYEERHDFDLYVSLAKIFAPQTLTTLRGRYGDEATYSFLVGLVVDELVDLEFSCLGLESLVRQFGVEGLLIDDRLPDGLFAKRGQAPHRYSIIEICCQSIEVSADACLEWGYILLALYDVLDKGYRTQLVNTVAEQAHTSTRNRLVLELLEGRLSPEEFRERSGEDHITT